MLTYIPRLLAILFWSVLFARMKKLYEESLICVHGFSIGVRASKGAVA